MVQIKALVWDEWNSEHIKKHHVSIEEVEELCQGYYKNLPTYGERYLILGRTKAGRALTIVLARQKPGVYYLITARDMSKKERRLFLNE